jgi:hypothetical protein
MSRNGLAVILGAAAGLSCLAPLAARAGDLPPPQNAHPGECYGKVILPAAYSTARRQELVRQAWTETQRSVAVVEKVAKRVLVRPEVIERTRTAPVYRTEVTWEQGPDEVSRINEPARYETVREKVLVSAGHAEWRRTDAPLAYGETSSGQTVLQATGEVVCRVWVPARYETVERRVKVSGGRSYEVVTPGARRRVVRQVLESAGGWTERRIAAVYRISYVERTVRSGRTRSIQHPAAYRTVETRTLVRPQREGWSRIVCGDVRSQSYVLKMQQALIAQGFDPGPADGAGRPMTYSALRSFQSKHNLPEGQITAETAQALGLN